MAAGFLHRDLFFSLELQKIGLFLPFHWFSAKPRSYSFIGSQRLTLIGCPIGWHAVVDIDHVEVTIYWKIIFKT